MSQNVCVEEKVCGGEKENREHSFIYVDYLREGH